MKQLCILLLITFIFSRKKDNVHPNIPDNGIYKITADGKVHESYEYENGEPARLTLFWSCETPTIKIEYGYSSDRITTIKHYSRSLYSSNSATMCDPNGKYDESTFRLDYDGQDRVSKISNGITIRQFQYYGSNVTMRLSDMSGGQSKEYTYRYNSRGNLIEETVPDPVNGGIVRYEYDDKVNPLAKIRSYIGSLNAFTSANNAIRAFDAQGNLLWERKFTYDRNGRPLTCLESNGVIYTYHYK